MAESGSLSARPGLMLTRSEEAAIGMLPDGLDDPTRCMPVAVRIGDPGHGVIGRLIRQQTERLCHDVLGVRPHQFNGPRFDPFGTLGRFSHDQHRFTERRGFFLHAAESVRINVQAFASATNCEYGCGGINRMFLCVPEPRVNDLFHLRIEMDRIDDNARRGGVADNSANAIANRLEPRTKVLATMAGDQNHWLLAPVGAEKFPELTVECPSHLLVLLPANLGQQGVNDRVSSDENRIVRHSFRQQRLPRCFRRREMERNQRTDKPAIRLFRKGRMNVASS